MPVKVTMPDNSIRFFDSYPRLVPGQGSTIAPIFEDVPILNRDWEFFRLGGKWRARPSRQRG